jgi:hypothetical protein
MLPETSRDMSITRTPSSGQVAFGSNDFSGTLIGSPFGEDLGTRLNLSPAPAGDKDG